MRSSQIRNSMVKNINTTKNTLNARLDTFMEEVVLRDKVTEKEIDSLRESLIYALDERIYLLKQDIKRESDMKRGENNAL